MPDFIISTDSCCDIYKSKLRAANVSVLPMSYIHNGEIVADTLDSDSEYAGFYNFLRAGNMPTTTQLNVVELTEYFEKLLNVNKGDIVHINLSSGLSGTYQNACAVAKDLETRYPGRKIYNVDSLGATVGQALVVDAAVKCRQDGMSAAETYEYAQKCAANSHYAIMANDLFHLRRGGRVSAASAVIGTLLQIKPILNFTPDGKLAVIDKVKGLTKALNTMVKLTRKTAVNIENQTIYIAHADAYENAMELKSLIQDIVPVSVTIGYIGPIIGTHTGPGALGIVCLGAEREKHK